MKRFNYILISVLLIFIAASCEDLATEGVSKTTTYPHFTLTGGSFYTTLVKNEAFVDPGVSAKIRDKDYAVTTEGTVDLTTPGLYFLNYTAYSDEKFPTKTQRIVLVTNTELTNDYSGDYDRSGANATISLNTEYLGYYHMTTVWSGTTTIPIDFVDLGGGDLLIVPGSSAYGRHNGTGKVQPNGDIWFTVTLLDQGPLTSVRKWVKK
ncbi:MAG: DUF5011 domain-containing protein [Bacteroidota bacterium]|nr:DUF5011 domain-containing protein [Bacteroidota bacterium]MDP4206857.1 DUF5011 domain-containing protein [Bacteroidota bacterium]